MMADYKRQKLATEISWTDHYSQKYDRCFVKTVEVYGNVSIASLLLDAFERSTLAESNGAFCQIDARSTDCGKVGDFISEHMKD
jgi:hypothetical protein